VKSQKKNQLTVNTFIKFPENTRS